MYETEYEMIKRLEKHYKNSLVFKEIGSGYGIADLVIMKNKSSFGKFLDQRYGNFLFNNDQIKIFMFLRKKKKGTTFEEILRNHYISASRLKYSILKHLISVGAITKNQDLYYRNPRFSLFASRTVAIEGKLSDWQGGLTQAIRYQRFAQQVYVALDEDFIHRVNIEEFKKFNVGLISVGSKVNEILPAETSSPLDPIMRYAISERILEKSIQLNTRGFRKIHF